MSMMRLSILLLASAVLGSAASASALTVTATASLDGAQEVPPNVTPGTGTGSFVYDTDTNELSFHIEFSGLLSEELASHIHGPGPVGVDAPIRHFLPLDSPKDGTVVLTDDQEGFFLDALLYVNVHSEGFPGGEIRGQIVPAAIPAPAAGVLLALGLAGVAVARVTRRTARD